MRITARLILALTMFTAIAAGAVQVFNSSNVNLGQFSKVKCGTGLTCTKESGTGNLSIVSSPTVSGAAITIQGLEGVDGILNISTDDSDNAGDDWAIKAEASGNALAFQNDASGSLATLLSISTVGDVVMSGTTPYLTVGDAGAEDAGVAFDGNAQDFHVSLDDSTDDLVIGLGVAAGTTDAIRIDENQDVTFVQNVRGLGTDSLSGFLQKQVASTSVAITAAQCGSTFVSNSADVMVLPEASTVLGCRLTFVCGTADDFDVDPADGTDVILPTGALTPSAGDAIRCTDAGAGFVLEAVGANSWAVLSTNLTITDVD